MPHQIHTYTELQQQIHADLRIQHPEWIQANGESPTCDSYESRLMHLLDAGVGDLMSLSLRLTASTKRAKPIDTVAV